MKVNNLESNEYAPYYGAYFTDVVQTSKLVEKLEISIEKFEHFIRDIPEDKYDYSYREGKWTIKDIIQHLIDSERIFAYRALRFSRNDITPLQGFEQNSYVDNACGSERNINDLLTEMSALRLANIMFFKSLKTDDLIKKGIASGFTVSVRALGFLIVAHQNHHMKIIKERYL